MGKTVCCAVPIRTGITSAKNLGVAITLRRNVLFYLFFKVFDFLFHRFNRLVKTFGCPETKVVHFTLGVFPTVMNPVIFADVFAITIINANKYIVVKSNVANRNPITIVSVCLFGRVKPFNIPCHRSLSLPGTGPGRGLHPQPDTKVSIFF